MARISPHVEGSTQFATATMANSPRGWVAVVSGNNTENPMTALSYLHTRSDSMTPVSCSAYLTEDHRLDFRRKVFNALDAATAAGESAVILDLSGVVAMDASGLGVLILLQKRARERGQRVQLLSVPSVVRRFFEDTRLSPLFDIVRSA